MTKQYNLTVNTHSGVATFVYGDDGLLTEFHCEMIGLSDVQLHYILAHAPTLETLKSMVDADKKNRFKLTEYTGDISFNDWYINYPRKDGNKKKAEKAFNDLNKNNRWLAHMWLPKYKNILAKNPTQAVLHAVTYLNQKRWEE